MTQIKNALIFFNIKKYIVALNILNLLDDHQAPTRRQKISKAILNVRKGFQPDSLVFHFYVVCN